MGLGSVLDSLSSVGSDGSEVCLCLCLRGSEQPVGVRLCCGLRGGDGGVDEVVKVAAGGGVRRGVCLAQQLLLHLLRLLQRGVLQVLHSLLQAAFCLGLGLFNKQVPELLQRPAQRGSQLRQGGG